MAEKKQTKLSWKIWTSIMVFGLFGQMAWIVENMYLNVFMYETVTYDLTATSWMVAASAIVATLATLFAGAFSDKIGKRKVFVSWGYIIWGITVMAFALISVKNTEALFPKANSIKLTIAFIIIMDCVMSFIGSSANDAAFNAWVTDITDSTNRGKAEGVLQVMPLLATLAVFGGFDFLAQQGKWALFFIILGTITSAIGVLGLFLMKDSPALKPKKQKYLPEIIYGFRPSVIKKNKNLYIVYAGMAIVGIANMTYIPYLMIYVEYFLGFNDYVILLGIVILLSALASVGFGMISDKFDRRKFFIPGMVLYVAGGIGIYFSTTMATVAITGFLLMTGNLAVSALLAALARDLTPADKAGLFQGIRMFFFVLIPMCIGPFIGAFISKTSDATYIDAATGAAQPVPSNAIFLAAVVILVLLVVPLIFIFRMKKDEMNVNAKSRELQAEMAEAEAAETEE